MPWCRLTAGSAGSGQHVLDVLGGQLLLYHWMHDSS
jgi:hypothetical protein